MYETVVGREEVGVPSYRLHLKRNKIIFEQRLRQK
jgi:hypothetical protein